MAANTIVNAAVDMDVASLGESHWIDDGAPGGTLAVREESTGAIITTCKFSAEGEPA
jgi:hypothetical protein